MTTRMLRGQWLGLRACLCVLACPVWVACTGSPHISQAAFDDAWGDRGAQVYARDVAWCVAATESRRSLVAGCLLKRGWVAKEGP